MHCRPNGTCLLGNAWHAAIHLQFASATHQPQCSFCLFDMRTVHSDWMHTGATLCVTICACKSAATAAAMAWLSGLLAVLRCESRHVHMP